MAGFLDTLTALPGQAWAAVTRYTRGRVQGMTMAMTGMSLKPVWPPEADAERLQEYHRNHELYEGEQQKFFTGRNKWEPENKRRPYVCTNLLGLLSDKLANRAFGEPFTVTVPTADGDATQEFVDWLLATNDLHDQVKDAACEQSYYGDVAAKVVYDAEERAIVVQFLHPGNVFPEWDPLNQDRLVACNVDQVLHLDGRCYLWRERHELRGDGSWVLNKLYRMEQDRDGTYHVDYVEDEVPLDATEATAHLVPEAATGINALLVVFVRQDSDYTDALLSLQGEYNDQQTRQGTLFAKHLERIMAGPEPSLDALNADNTVDVKQLRYLVMPEDGTMPVAALEYQAAAMPAVEARLDRIKADFAVTAGIDAQVLFPDAAAAAPSGEAMRRQQQATQETVSNRHTLWRRVLREVLWVCVELAATEGHPLAWQPEQAGTIHRIGKYQVSVSFGDGLPSDREAQVRETDLRIANGTMSPAQAIAELDGLTQADAEERYQEIVAAQQAARAPAPAVNVTSPFAGIQPVTPGGG